jgi:hypothetical protein
MYSDELEDYSATIVREFDRVVDKLNIVPHNGYWFSFEWDSLGNMDNYDRMRQLLPGIRVWK